MEAIKTETFNYTVDIGSGIDMLRRNRTEKAKRKNPDRTGTAAHT